MRYNNPILTTLIFSKSNDSTKECTMELGSRIRALRTARGLSQETIAERLQVSRQAVAKWESGGSLR